jgi:hypothetical protein
MLTPAKGFAVVTSWMMPDMVIFCEKPVDTNRQSPIKMKIDFILLVVSVKIEYAEKKSERLAGWPS